MDEGRPRSCSPSSRKRPRLSSPNAPDLQLSLPPSDAGGISITEGAGSSGDAAQDSKEDGSCLHLLGTSCGKTVWTASSSASEGGVDEGGAQDEYDRAGGEAQRPTEAFVENNLEQGSHGQHCDESTENHRTASAGEERTQPAQGPDVTEVADDGASSQLEPAGSGSQTACTMMGTPGAACASEDVGASCVPSQSGVGSVAASQHIEEAPFFQETPALFRAVAFQSAELPENLEAAAAAPDEEHAELLAGLFDDDFSEVELSPANRHEKHQSISPQRHRNALAPSSSAERMFFDDDSPSRPPKKLIRTNSRKQKSLMSSDDEFADDSGFFEALGDADLREAIDSRKREVFEAVEEARAPVAFGFTSGSGKSVAAPSAEAMRKVEERLSSSQRPSSSQRRSSPSTTDGMRNSIVAGAQLPFMGFMTGANKPVAPPSEEAMQRALGMLSSPPWTSGKGQNEGLDKSLLGGDNASRGGEAGEELVLSSSVSSPVAESFGFSTGAGRAIPKPSREAMLLAQARQSSPPLQPVCTNGDQSTMRSAAWAGASVIGGFLKASGKKMALPSAAALRAAEKRFSELQGDDLIIKAERGDTPLQPADQGLAPGDARPQRHAMPTLVQDDAIELAASDTPSKVRAPLAPLPGNEPVSPSRRSSARRRSARLQHADPDEGSKPVNIAESNTEVSLVAPQTPTPMRKRASEAQDAIENTAPIPIAPKAIRATGVSAPSGMSPALFLKATQHMPASQAGFRTPMRPAAVTPLQRTSLRTQISGSRLAGGAILTPGASQSTPSAKRISLGMTPRSQGAGLQPGGRPRFNTPFKQGKRPEGLLSTATPGFKSATRVPGTAKQLATVRQPGDMFNLEIGAPRLSLAAYGIRPESVAEQEMIQRGAPEEVAVILQNPACASHYMFNGPNDEPLGTQQALAELHSAGGVHVTSAWIENHWSLILWKLSALVRHKPEDSDLRWNWQEVLRQLKYRYEREVNRAQRPLIKRIQEHDSSAALPMVLCVSRIVSAAPSTSNLRSDDSMPSASQGLAGRQSAYVLELTDGWYRIRANIDSTLSRAVGRARIKVGSKLAMAGARLSSPGEGTDVLQALDTSTLSLTGNSTSLARWDARLGPSARPFIASLRSLTADGGVVMAMDIVITRLFPIAYVDVDRQGVHEARGEAEEAELQEAWQKKHEDTRQKLQTKWEDRLAKLEMLREVLERAADKVDLETANHQGFSAEQAEQAFSQLEAQRDPRTVLQTLSPHVVPHLASLARQRCLYEREEAQAEVVAELEDLCPTRKVRDFRVVRFRDARSGRRTPSPRTVQLTVWDVQSLGEDVLQEGRRYLVTNLAPSQRSSWRKPNEPGDIFLTTRRDTRWQMLALAS